MKKKLIQLSAVLFVSLLMTSCYSYTTVVGDGSQGNQQISKWNHYLIGGLAPIDVSDSAILAGGVQDYTVKTEMSFVNGLVSALTGGIYAPTTTTIYK
ncbi:MAG: Bor family protein [Fermentimonas sp.]|nr:Bor family protein [Fermentimonas sp.]MDD4696450.1 Bor family protein [Fermentimonas sp.]